MSWWRSAIKEVNDWALNGKIRFVYFFTKFHFLWKNLQLNFSRSKYVVEKFRILSQSALKWFQEAIYLIIIVLRWVPKMSWQELKWWYSFCNYELSGEWSDFSTFPISNIILGNCEIWRKFWFGGLLINGSDSYPKTLFTKWKCHY